MKLAVMGCIVNGPGESKAANIGISLPGTGEAPRCPVYIDGKHFNTLEGTYDELSAAFQKLVDDYISTKYAKREHPLPEVTVPPAARSRKIRTKGTCVIHLGVRRLAAACFKKSASSSALGEARLAL